MQLGLLAFLVLAASIISFFSDEFAQFFKKLFKIKGAYVFLPLLVASGLIRLYKDLFLGVLLTFQTWLRYIMIQLMSCLPFHTGAAFITQVMCLFILSSLPAWGLYWLVKTKKWGKATEWAGRAYVGLWFFLIMLWIA